MTVTELFRAFLWNIGGLVAKWGVNSELVVEVGIFTDPYLLSLDHKEPILKCYIFGEYISKLVFG